MQQVECLDELSRLQAQLSPLREELEAYQVKFDQLLARDELPP